MVNDAICFSVIMPCYNSAAYVGQAVQSLINQTYANWELIAINDGSCDNTLDILSGFSDKDKRIKVFSKKNGGYVSAVNLGLEKVSGDYFLMMGSDDMLADTLFERIAMGICSSGEALPDAVAFRSVKYENGVFFERDPISDFESAARMDGKSIAEFEKQYPKNARIFFIRDTSKCFKTSKIGKLRYFGKYGYDSDGVFSSLFVHGCSSFLSLPIDGYLWTIRRNSVSANVDLNKNTDRIKVWKKYLSRILKDKEYTLAEQEKKYVVMPFILCADLINRSRRLFILKFALLNKTLRLSIKVAEKKNVDLSEYKRIKHKNPVKRTFDRMFPCVRLLRRGDIKS